jgi:hypothetical protein
VAARNRTSVCGRSLTGVAGSNPAGGMDMDVSCECCVFSGRGLCVGLITHPEKSSECGMSDRKASTKRMPWATRCSGIVKILYESFEQ